VRSKCVSSASSSDSNQFAFFLPGSLKCTSTLQSCLLLVSSFTEIRKPGSAPSNTSTAPPTNSFNGDVPLQERQVQQPQPAPVIPSQSQQPAAPVFAGPQVQSRGPSVPSSRPASRFPGKQTGTGIPEAPTAALYQPSLPAAAPAPLPLQPVSYRQQVAADVGRPACTILPSGPAPVQRERRVSNAAPPARNEGDDLLSTIVAAEDDLITAHR
jgi:hypothetical protein